MAVPLPITEPIPLDTQKRLAADLRAVLSRGGLLESEEERRPYECDGLSAYRQLPLLVAMPQTEQQVVDVLKVCHALRVPVVARGAGTSLSGGALPLANGVLLSLAKLNKIISIDPKNRVAHVQPGVRNLAISEATAQYGLYYAPDPSSQIACSIGGNVAENAGGVHCLKYGLTVHNVLGIRSVTIDGQTIEIGGETLDGPGYDLLALLTGSEGMLGVVVEITVKLLPRPEHAQVVLAAFTTAIEASEAV
ncbi:MAG TPA: FAD-binding protein, partial [Burkholderiales bacterium]|nr:FAD-binding protein [Burkholderiales bacterium]